MRRWTGTTPLNGLRRHPMPTAGSACTGSPTPDRCSYRRRRSTPPHLSAIASAFTSLDYYQDWIYPGEALSSAFVASWGVAALARESARRLGRAELREELESSLRHQPGSYWHLPLLEYPHLLERSHFFSEWLAHPWRDEFWSADEPESVLSFVDLPALHIGCWSDVFVRGTLATFSSLVSKPDSRPTTTHRALAAHAVDSVGSSRAWRRARPRKCRRPPVGMVRPLAKNGEQ
jgi:X-Pro dipeptidyl-peptidase (S15 family)